MIVGISLISSLSGLNTSRVSATERDFYFSKDVYPDHILYPAVSFLDRLQLAMTNDIKQKVLLQVNFSRDRLKSAQALYDKKRPDLALDTLNKSHHYLITAADLTIENKLDKEVVDHLLRYLAFMDSELERLMGKVDDTGRARISVMREEQQSFRERWQ